MLVLIVPRMLQIVFKILVRNLNFDKQAKLLNKHVSLFSCSCVETDTIYGCEGRFKDYFSDQKHG